MVVMKTSRKQSILAALLVAGVSGTALLAGTGTSIPARADTATTTTAPAYKPWSGAAGQQLKSLIADLRAKIATAESSQAASPDFLDDLKALATKYEAMQTSGTSATATTGSSMAAGTQVFNDDFSDNDYTSNPAWKVSAGTWTVDKSGKRSGLVSKIRPQKINVNNVLGALLSQNQSTGTSNQFASIYTPAKIPNAFVMTVKLQSSDKQGALNLGVYQGSAGSTLYRMVYQPGAAPGLSIQKVTPDGATTLGSYNSVVSLEDEAMHTLVFSRDSTGNMKISLDGKDVATAKDTSLTGDMSGVLFINSGGAYWIRSVNVVSN
jgi:hypothetical protein